LVLDEHGTPGRMLLTHPRSAENYRRFMSVVYHLPRTCVPLLQAALERSRALAEADDAIAEELADYLEHHIEEEMHGDEPGGPVLEDLARIGVDVHALRLAPPPLKMVELIGAQYYWIRHEHPVALLGYLEVLEGFHPQREHIDALQRRTGLPRDAFGQLYEHAEVDIGHKQELEDLLDRLPLTERQHTVLGVNALQTVDLLTQALLPVFDHPPIKRG
jgi:hypothetical protein